MKKKTITIKCDEMPRFIDLKALRRSQKMFEKSGISVTIVYTWPVGTIDFNPISYKGGR